MFVGHRCDIQIVPKFGAIFAIILDHRPHRLPAVDRSPNLGHLIWIRLVTLEESAIATNRFVLGESRHLNETVIDEDDRVVRLFVVRDDDAVCRCLDRVAQQSHLAIPLIALGDVANGGIEIAFFIKDDRCDRDFDRKDRSVFSHMERFECITASGVCQFEPVQVGFFVVIGVVPHHRHIEQFLQFVSQLLAHLFIGIDHFPLLVDQHLRVDIFVGHELELPRVMFGFS